MACMFFGDGGNLIPEKPRILGMGLGIEPLKVSGIFWGRGKHKSWGFLGQKPRKTPNFGVRSGLEPLKGSGMIWGRGKVNFRGIFGGKSPKIPKFRSGDGGQNLGDFPHTSYYDLPQSAIPIFYRFTRVCHTNILGLPPPLNYCNNIFERYFLSYNHFSLTLRSIKTLCMYYQYLSNH